MAFINLLGEREGTVYNSELYKEKVIEFLSKRGHMLVGDSSTDGTLPDLVFYHPQHGECETRVETKYENVSLSDKGFLQEIGGYFISYMKMSETKRYYFHIFVRKCSNQAKWKKIFDETRSTVEEIEKFRNEILKVLDEPYKKQFESHSPEDFYRFIMNSKVWQVNYEVLSMKIENISEEKFDSLKYIYEDIEPQREKEEIIGNFMKVIKFPQNVFITKISSANKELYRGGKKGIYSPFRDKLISLGSTSNIKKLDKFLYLNSTVKKSFLEWVESESESYRVVQQLIKCYVIRKGLLAGAEFDYPTNTFYFPHRNKRKNPQKIKDKQVSKIYFKNDEAYFFEHLGFSIDVPYLANEFYLVINPVRLFTINGWDIITGTGAKKLHEKFSPRYDFNNTIKAHFLWFSKILSLDKSPLDGSVFFIMSGPISLEINWKPKVEIEYDETFATSLDHFEEENELDKEGVNDDKS